MSGRTRFEVPETARFISVGNLDRGNLFYEEADYHHCLCRLKTVTDYYGCFVHAYALLEDNLYLLVSACRQIGVYKAMKLLESDYGSYFDITHRRIHRKLALTYSLLPVAGHQLLTFCRYIELAPVRAALVVHPADYPWSSYACNAMGEDTGLVTFHERYLCLGRDEEARRYRYRLLFEHASPAPESYKAVYSQETAD